MGERGGREGKKRALQHSDGTRGRRLSSSSRAVVVAMAVAIVIVVRVGDVGFPSVLLVFSPSFPMLGLLSSPLLLRVPCPPTSRMRTLVRVRVVCKRQKTSKPNDCTFFPRGSLMMRFRMMGLQHVCVRCFGARRVSSVPQRATLHLPRSILLGMPRRLSRPRRQNARC